MRVAKGAGDPGGIPCAPHPGPARGGGFFCSGLKKRGYFPRRHPAFRERGGAAGRRRMDMGRDGTPSFFVPSPGNARQGAASPAQ